MPQTDPQQTERGASRTSHQHGENASAQCRQQIVDTWAGLCYVIERTTATPPATENDRMKMTHLEGVPIRRLPDAPESPAKYRRSQVSKLIDARTLDSLRADRDQFGSDSSTDDRGYAPTFQESDQELEAAGTTQVAADLDGIFHSYLAR